MTVLEDSLETTGRCPFYFETVNNTVFPSGFRGNYLSGGCMDKWRCTICDWVYDPATGDPDGGIAPGTPFEKIPDGWMCPVCGAGKDMFEKV
jgi:rubredoxin